MWESVIRALKLVPIFKRRCAQLFRCTQSRSKRPFWPPMNFRSFWVPDIWLSDEIVQKNWVESCAVTWRKSSICRFVSISCCCVSGLKSFNEIGASTLSRDFLILIYLLFCIAWVMAWLMMYCSHRWLNLSDEMLLSLHLPRARLRSVWNCYLWETGALNVWIKILDGARNNLSLWESQWGCSLKSLPTGINRSGNGVLMSSALAW